MSDEAAHLPGLLGVLARAGHLGAALRLAKEWGGTSRYIPEEPSPDSPLVQVVGLAAARLLAETYGRGHHDIPMATHQDTAKGRILRDPDPSTRAVARRYHVTERHVRDVRAMARPDPRQLDLFETTGTGSGS